jgi:hypothetical protein
MPSIIWKIFRWKRVVLTIFPIAILITAPIWHRLVHPEAYATMRCVIQASDGTLTKGVGDAQCANNSKAMLILRGQE